MGTEPSKRRRAHLAAWALLPVAAGLSGAAWAVDGAGPYESGLTPGQTVIDRPRPEVEQLGGRVGQFLVLPSLGLSEEYDDNIFATENDKEGDFITTIKPTVRVQSDWNNHQLNAFGWGAIGRYASNSDENWEDFAGGVDYRHDILRGTAARGGFKMARLHEDRTSPEDVNGQDPTTYTLMEPTAGITHGFGRFKVGVDGGLRRFDFDDTAAVGGTSINNDDRDRKEWQGGVRLGYEIQPEYEAFVRGAYNIRDYDSNVDDAGFERDSKGYELAVGTAVQLTDLIVGEVYVGYRSQDYDDTRLSTVSGLGAGADLTWSVTKLTSITGFFSRTVEESTQANAGGYFATRVGVRVDHELLRNLLLGASASYGNNDYEGISRTDDSYNFGASVKYLANRYLDLSAQYRHSRRESEAAGDDYDKNVFLVQATAKY